MIRLEERIQSEIVLWFHNTYPHLRGALHCNNNNASSMNKGSNMKAMGVYPGVSDLELLAPNGRTVFFEVKTSSGQQSPEQKRWMELVHSLGHIYVIVRSKSEFIEYVLNIYQL